MRSLTVLMDHSTLATRLSASAAFTGMEGRLFVIQLNSWSPLALEMLKPQFLYRLMTVRTFISKGVLPSVVDHTAIVQDLTHCDMVWRNELPLTQKVSMNSRQIWHLVMMGAGILMGW
jgi:hypothetical protein